MEIGDIFDEIGKYSKDPDRLVKDLMSCGINSFDEFISAAQAQEVRIPTRIQSDVEAQYAKFDEDDWNRTAETDTEDAYQRYLDNHPKGRHRDTARNKIADKQSEQDWNKVDKNDATKVGEFIKNTPASAPIAQVANKASKRLKEEEYFGINIQVVQDEINSLKTDPTVLDRDGAIYNKIVGYLDGKKITSDDLLEAIKEDNNFISATVAKRLWDNDKITDFSSTGIDKGFIKNVLSLSKPQASLPEPDGELKKITKSPCTECYFWGIPSSGKTCAIGAILSAANDGKTAKSMRSDIKCQGREYLQNLRNLFQNGCISALPEGTSVSFTYEMGFVLEDKQGKEHPITFIDLAGELLMYMHKSAKKMSEEANRVLNTLKVILHDNRTENRKIHFFVIEYGAENRSYDGLPQREYLDSALNYIEETNVFRQDTDAIYLLITKVDKAKAEGEELKDILTNYIKYNYASFYNGLKLLCKKNEINGGDVEIIPFSLGTVCFQNYCKFNDAAAANVVTMILNKSYCKKPGFWQKIKDFFKK